MHDNGPADPLKPLWTEELELLEISCGPSSLTLRRALTPVGRSGLHGSITLDGELCPATTPAVVDEGNRLVGLGVVEMCFDLHDLRLCTSAAVDYWIDLSDRLQRVGGELRLRNAGGTVRRVLDVCGVGHTPEL